MSLTNAVLNEVNDIFKNNSKNFDDNLRLKLYRALSWLNEAEEQKENLDFCFVSLWISFNAIYADELNFTGDRQGVKDFLQKIASFDDEKILHSILWNNFSNSIRVFLNNKFIFQKFWDDLNNFKEQKTSTWKEDFVKENKKAFQAMADLKTAQTLNIVFSRLYTLRNQILHGGATFNSSVNKKQKEDACKFLLNVLPAILKIIINNSGQNWGKPYYPVIDD